PPTGVEWFQNYKRPGYEWQNWSWNTSVTSARGRMKIKFDDGWAGFYLHSETGVSRATHLVFSADIDARLRVSINGPQGQGGEVIVETTQGNSNNYIVDLADIGNPDPITDVFFQNDSPGPLPEWSSERMYFRLSGRELAHHLHRQQVNNIRLAFEKAAQWSNARNLPLHLGEFGSFEEGSMPSRVRWTTSIRQMIDGMNLDWSYWELAAGFGVYDPANDEFRPELTRSLIPAWGD
ncbi:MAG: hypothetical protein AAF456_26040, partial [Planctomycetota bacterium]